jgi:hypothetical protein
MVRHRLRQSKKTYAYRKRHIGYSQNQRLEVVRLKLFMIQIVALKVAKITKTVLFIQVLDAVFCFAYYHYLQLILEPIFLLMPIVYLNRTIDSFHEEQAYHLFRFNKSDLKRLMVALRIPDTVVTQGRNKFSGEEVFLFSLITGRNCKVLFWTGVHSLE